MSGSLLFPNSTTIIGAHAFDGCLGLNGFLDFQSANITSIGACAFMSCYQLRGKLELPEALTCINKNCFSGCQFTGSLSIPDNVTVISENSFYRCQSFSGSLIIGKGVTLIDSSAFSECTGFDGKLIFNCDNLSHIRKRSFYKCTGFTGMLNIPDTIISIGGYAFYGCTGFTGNLVLPSHIDGIGNAAFSECTNFTGTLYIPASCTHIKSYAFYNCIGLEEIRFESDKLDCRIENKTFGHLSIKCFSNLPTLCHDNETCYDSDNFGGFNSFIPLNEQCTLFYAVNTIVTTIMFCCSAGVFGIAGNFITEYIKNRKTISKRLRAVFDEIISSEREDKENEEVQVTKIINSINIFMKSEIDDDFNLSSDKVLELINESIDAEWMTMKKSSMQLIRDRSLEGVTFPVKKPCCSKPPEDGKEDELESDVVSAALI